MLISRPISIHNFPLLLRDLGKFPPFYFWTLSKLDAFFNMNSLSPFLIVLWKKEQKYSMVRREKIFDPVLKQKVDKELWNMSLSVKWTGNKPYEAEVIDTGSMEEMKAELLRLENEMTGGGDFSSSSLAVPSSSSKSGITNVTKVKVETGHAHLKRKLEPKKHSAKQVKANNQSSQISKVLELLKSPDEEDGSEKNSNSNTSMQMNERDVEEENEFGESSGIYSDDDDDSLKDSNNEDDDEREKQKKIPLSSKLQSQNKVTEKTEGQKSKLHSQNQNKVTEKNEGQESSLQSQNQIQSKIIGKNGGEKSRSANKKKDGGGAAEKFDVLFRNKISKASSSGSITFPQTTTKQGNGQNSGEKTTNKSGNGLKMSNTGKEQRGKNSGTKTGTRNKVGVGSKASGCLKTSNTWERPRTRSVRGNSIRNGTVDQTEDGSSNVNRGGERTGFFSVGEGTQTRHEEESRERNDDEMENGEQEDFDIDFNDLDNDLEEPVEITEQPTRKQYEQVVKQLEDSQSLLEKYRNRNTALKAKVDKLESERGPGMRDLGHGVRVRATGLETMMALSTTPTIFARNLMRFLFTEEELYNKSLFGQETGGNGNPYPELEPDRRNAVINTTMDRYGQKDEKGRLVSGDPLQTVIHKTLGDLLREIRHKVNRRRAQQDELVHNDDDDDE